MFVSPRPTQAAITASYDTADGVHETWDVEEEGRRLMWAKRVARVRAYVDSGRVLDIGAGFGDFLHQLTATGNWEVVGTEVSRDAAEHARTVHHLDVRDGQVEDTGVCGPFELITLFHVLEHLPSPGGTLRLVADLLAPGGHLVMALPNDSPARLGYLRGRDRLKRPVVQALGRPYRSGVDAYFGPPVPRTEIHLTHFSRQTLVDFLSRLGFEVVEVGVDDLTARPTPRSDAVFHAQRAVLRLFSVNTGEAMFVVARKP
ncbi:MAG: ubiG 1 [Frankiales bacterium]|nr:ubiG 1 [Frankiales bacterium]